MSFRMRPQILKRALQAWPAWGDSISEARKKFAFAPQLSEDEYRLWEAQYGWKAVVEECLHVLDALWLPWWFADYWLWCFYGSNVPALDCPWSAALTDILERDRLQHYAGYVMFLTPSEDKKPAPPYPFLLQTPFPIGQRRKSRSSASKIDPAEQQEGWQTVFSSSAPGKHFHCTYFCDNRRQPSPLLFKLEIPIFLATDDVLRAAFRQMQFYRDGFLHNVSYPLPMYMQKLKLGRGSTEAFTEDTLGKYAKGEISIDQLLREEFSHEREMLALWEEAYGRGGERYKERETELAHRVYKRVRQRLTRRGLMPAKPRRGWWRMGH